MYYNFCISFESKNDVFTVKVFKSNSININNFIDY